MSDIESKTLAAKLITDSLSRLVYAPQELEKAQGWKALLETALRRVAAKEADATRAKSFKRLIGKYGKGDSSQAGEFEHASVARRRRTT